MFPKYRIKALTNGVHAMTWLSRPMQEVLDREIPEWRHDNIYLRYAINIPLRDVREAHARAKRTLLNALNDATGERLEEDVFTIGFARRATGYKRADLLFRDAKRLEEIVKKAGKLQIIYGGKAHPRDDG
jgi:starch phosphorylase